MVAEKLVVNIHSDGELILSLEDEDDQSLDLVFADSASLVDGPLWQRQLRFLSIISGIVNKQGGIERE